MSVYSFASDMALQSRQITYTGKTGYSRQKQLKNMDEVLHEGCYS